MHLPAFRHFARGVTTGILVSSMCFAQNLSTQTHIVSRAELQSALIDAGHSRDRNFGAILTMLSAADTEKALRSAHINTGQLKSAVSSLSDEELTRLAARTNSLRADVAAGRLSDRDLLLILIGLAALILIIVAVD